MADEGSSARAPRPASRAARAADRVVDRVVFDRGVHVRGTVVWADTRRRERICFVSRAGIPGVPLRTTTLCTPETARRTSAIRGARAVRQPLLCPPGRRFTIGPLEVDIASSGYCPGAIQLRIGLDGAWITYSGDWSLQSSPDCDPYQPLPSDVWVMRWCAERGTPTAEHAASALEDWTRQALAQRGVVIWRLDVSTETERALRWATGTGAEVVTPAGIRRIAHRAPGLGSAARIREISDRPTIVLWPHTQALPSRWRQAGSEVPVARLSADEEVSSSSADALHADLIVSYRLAPSSAELAERAKAQGVSHAVLVGPPDPIAEAALTDQGIDYRALGAERQLRLDL